MATKEPLQREVVRARLQQGLQPLLTARAFSGFQNDVSTRATPTRTDVVAVQFFPKGKLAKWGLPSNSFSVAVGSQFSFLPAVFGKEAGQSKQPNPALCHVRLTPSRGIWQLRGRRHPNIWVVDENGKNLEKCAEDAARVLSTAVLPWFSRFDDLQELERTLLEDEEQFDKAWGFGRKGSPLRKLLLGLVAAQLKHFDIARDNLNQAVEHHGLVELAGSDEPLHMARKVLAAIGT